MNKVKVGEIYYLNDDLGYRPRGYLVIELKDNEIRLLNINWGTDIIRRYPNSWNATVRHYPCYTVSTIGEPTFKRIA